MGKIISKENALIYREFNLLKDPKEHFSLLISKPEMLNKNEYQCFYSIIGNKINITLPVSGYDSLQALLLALLNAYVTAVSNHLNVSIDGKKNSDFIKFYTDFMKYIQPRI